MKFFMKVTATAISALCANAAWSADYTVMRSLELSSPATETWGLIGGFCDIDDWHPNIVACSLKVMDGSLVRVLTTDAGDRFVQKRIADEVGLSYTYKNAETSLPIEDLTATFSIEHFGESSLIAWSVNFSSEDPTMEQVVADEIDVGMAAIESIFDAR